jgi:hypothetical protein
VVWTVQNGSCTSSCKHGNLSTVYVCPVAAGVNTFTLELTKLSGNGTMFGDWGELAALYSPFGSTGDGTLGTAAADTAATTEKSLNGD